MGQNLTCLEYGNCCDLTHVRMLMQCFIHVKVSFQDRNLVLLIEKFPFLVLARNTVNTLLSIFHSIIYQTVLPCGRLKTNENFKLLALKVVTVVYERWSLSYKRFQVCSCDLEPFGILENWSLKTGGCFWEVVQLKVRLQAKTFCFAFLITHASLVTKVHNNSQNDLKMADQSSQLPL